MKGHAVFTLGLRLVVTVCLTALVPVHAGDPILQPPKTAVPAAQTVIVMKAPLVFESTQNQTASTTQFTSRGAGYSLFLTPSEAVLVLTKGSENSSSNLERRQPRHRRDGRDREGRASSVVRMKMVGANPAPCLSGRDELPSKSHYFIGNDPSQWRTNVPNYAKVQYEEVYPGVGLVFYGNQRQLEYDFVIAPGADPRQIKLTFEGADELKIDAEGNLVLRIDGGEVLFHKPIVYQELDGHKQPVAGAFMLGGESEVSFQVASYDTARPLVIDPVLSYSTFLGGRFEDSVSAIAVDSEGSAYVTGFTRSDNFPTLNPLPATPFSQFFTAFVSKFNGAGQLVYSTHLGGLPLELPFDTLGRGIAVDASGNAYVTGVTVATNFPTVNAFQSTNNGPDRDFSCCFYGSEAFVAKLSPSGSSLLYSTYLGGVKAESGNAIAVDNAGNAYVTGSTQSRNFPTRNALFPAFHGNSTSGSGGIPDDVFVAKLAPSGSALVFSTYLGGILSDVGWGIAVDAAGNVHVTGETLSYDFPTTNAFQPTFRPRSDAFVTKFTAAGESLIYSTYLGGRAWLEVTPWVVDFGIVPSGQKDLPVTLNNTGSGTLRISETRVSSVGQQFALVNAPVVPFTLAPGQQITLTVRLLVNSSPFGDHGFLIISGREDAGTSQVDFTLNVALIQNYQPGEFTDSEFASRATFLYDGQEVGRAISVDKSGNAWVCGETQSRAFPVVAGLQTALGNPDYRRIHDAFITRFDPIGRATYSTYLGGTNGDGASGIALDGAGNVYVAGSTTSTNFPPTTNLVAPVYSLDRSDAYVAKLDPAGSTLTSLIYVGGSDIDGASGIALDPAGNVYIAGTTYSTNFPVINAAQPVYGGDQTNTVGSVVRGDGFVARLGVVSQQAATFQVWQKLQLPGVFSSTSTNDVRVQFVRPDGSGGQIVAQAPIVSLTPSNVTVRVPPDLLGPSDVSAPPSGCDSNITIRIITGFPQSPQTNVLRDFVFCFPRPLIVDEVSLPGTPVALFPQVATTPRTLLQFQLNDPAQVNDPLSLATFVYVGRSTDGFLALRTLNTTLAQPQPLDLTDGITVFEPALIPQTNPVVSFYQTLPFTIHNLGFGSEGKQFNVSRNGLYIMAVEPRTNSPGPFPAPFQIHLAGNVGLPRKLVNGVAEFPRGTRLDILFNHTAPRPQILRRSAKGTAETAPFKFASQASIYPFAAAVLIPPSAAGFPVGTQIIRAPDPNTPLDITLPTARTECVVPAVGTVTDFTQLPDPASVAPAPSVGGTICSVIGQSDGLGVSLPLAIGGGINVSTVILDMGSGHEIVDGTGPDFQVVALSGSYILAVGNTPYVGSFVSIPGTFTGIQTFDLASVGLSSARFVLISAAPSVVLDAVQSANVFADQVVTGIGPVTKLGSATILVRRSKTTNELDPFIELIAPSGVHFAENESGFGDELTLDRSDSALSNVMLNESGLYRYVVRGYHLQPDEQAFGAFYTRLETPGKYDQQKISISATDEANTLPQRQGTINTTRQRDSYLFEASGGQTVNIVVNAKAGLSTINPVVEVYDREDFLIAANDDYPQRASNSALSVTLSGSGTNTYRIVVSALDGFGSIVPFSTGKAHIRQAASGNYELKVFTGALSGPAPVGAPRIDSINPSSAAAGTQVTISGANFSPTLTSNIVLFGSVQATVVTASTTQLVVVVPPGVPAGSATLTVRVGGQTSAPINFQISVPVTRTAAARLHCLSLRFLPATGRFAGQDYTLELTSLFDPAPPNGELYPLFDPLDFSHSSDFRLRGISTQSTIDGFIFVDVPMTSDADRDGVPDFLQISSGVGSTQTQGEYFTDTDDGTVTATWSRTAGSRTGVCRIVLRSSFLGQVADFTNAFDLLEYSGPLTYTPGTSNVTGTVQFAQTQSASNILTGPIQFTRSATNRFNELRFSSGLWTNGVARTLSYNSGVLQRVSASSSNYFGSLGFLDGDLVTTAADYFDWILAVRDTNDVDGDGIPDLSDDPSSASGPAFTRPRVEAGQIVLEWQGTGRLQSAAEITGPWAEIPGAMSPFRQNPIGARQYFRIAP